MRGKRRWKNTRLVTLTNPHIHSKEDRLELEIIIYIYNPRQEVLVTTESSWSL